MKPEFLIIGAQKSGTTSLADALARHSAVFVSEPREPEYFSRAGSAGGMSWEEYEGLFAPAPTGARCGEASTGTMLDPSAIVEIDRRLPEVKLIAILREPVSRAYSGMTHAVKKGRVATDEGVAEFGREARRYLAGEQCRHDWFARSEYSRQLRPFRDHFGDRLKMVIFEELVANEATILAEIQRFLNLEVEDLTMLRENQSRVPKGRVTESLVALGRGIVGPVRHALGEKGYRRFRERLMGVLGRRLAPVDPALKKELQVEGFAGEVGRMEEILGRPIEAWR